ncbi:MULTISPECIES: tRNA preQ1(34) S-adenosylmethionine ribosyltransferase-isomerase QueA [Ferrimicrobium]|uniref:S-adenosylmethionine:tRNA ribosyltransferase-isomerase n=1 Tax=Ferrimicrobium acidiphilum TaxID=121039 RepID=A0ABV3Y576_9ACTN|nr:tRNA preQ1(34) S-adenosylmethionine ribosyltransferase-isomerase QueA [Ferrimicrobium sp.]
MVGRSDDWSLIDAYDYDLPPERIARVPAEPRSSAKLLVGTGDKPYTVTVADLGDLLEPGDVVVVNDSKVVPARFHVERESGGRVEVLLLAPQGVMFEALIRPNARIRAGELLYLSGSPVFRVHEGGTESSGLRIRLVEVLGDAVFSQGEIPLPPYLAGVTIDPQRYQTVYAKRPGSVAAPTAGLHFDAPLLADLERRGIEIVSVDLEVGLGTFAPVKERELARHTIHSERYRVTPEAVEHISAATRVVAIGTTVVRTLETVAHGGDLVGSSQLFIRPGFDFRCVDLVLTNFHVPRSTLVALVAAAIGSRWRTLYEYALANDFRFLSLGDAMLIPTNRPRGTDVLRWSRPDIVPSTS